MSTFASVFRCGIVVKDLFVMVLNDAAHVRHATVANFHVVLVEDGVEIVVGGKCFLIRLKKVLATLV